MATIFVNAFGVERNDGFLQVQVLSFSFYFNDFINVFFHQGLRYYDIDFDDFVTDLNSKKIGNKKKETK